MVEPSKVYSNSVQPQSITLKGSISNDYDGNGFSSDSEGNNRLQNAQSVLSNGIKGYQQYSGGGSTPWGAIAGAGKGLYNMITDKNPSEYSDVEQSTIYPLQGAAMGSQFGPWGAAAGALYGLGYSFKDDIGLDDDNFLTDFIFPIGMGDGGGFIDMG